MTAMKPVPLMPRQAVPPLDLPLIPTGRFILGAEPGARFDLLVFYRGWHCPICAKYLQELERLEPQFSQRGIQIVALSSDSEERAKQMADKVPSGKVKLAYGLQLQEARRWGLYISTSRGKTSIGVEEPPMFSEPGVLIVRPDGTLYYGAVQTMPFARPHFQELLMAVDSAIAKDYPARGEYSGHV